MKKIFALLLTIILSGLVFSGCSAGNKSTQSLTLNKKYIYENHISKPSDNQSYFIFKDGKTGEYNYYYIFNTISAYKISFKYLIIEDTVICFYDSIAYSSLHNNTKSNESDWKATLGFSKDILLATNNSMYICESYLPKIPNFGK